MAGNSELRRCLQEITDRRLYPGQTLSEIKLLARSNPHKIRRLYDSEPENYNCFACAFKLNGSPTYRIVAITDYEDGQNRFFANSKFVQFLIERRVLSGISEDEAGPGDVAVYFDDIGTPKHAGAIITEEKRIDSKWGGNLRFEHELWEVPASYGNEVRYYRGIPTDAAERAFLEFARSQDGWEEFARDHFPDLLC